MIRKAVLQDLEGIAAIYDRLHALEEQGLASIGWQRGVYPTRETAETAILAGDMFVDTREGTVAAAARINREQVPEYRNVPWQFAASDDQVMVLHTLAVSPDCMGRGLGQGFVAFYEDFALGQGCSCLRMDTNARNLAARSLYRKLGYREAGIVLCRFNGMDGVQLVCLEKRPG